MLPLHYRALVLGSGVEVHILRRKSRKRSFFEGKVPPWRKLWNFLPLSCGKPLSLYWNPTFVSLELRSLELGMAVVTCLICPTPLALEKGSPTYDRVHLVGLGQSELLSLRWIPVWVVANGRGAGMFKGRCDERTKYHPPPSSSIARPTFLPPCSAAAGLHPSLCSLDLGAEISKTFLSLYFIF